MHIIYDPLYTIICVVYSLHNVGLNNNSIDSNPLLRGSFHSLCFRKDLCSFAFLLLEPTIYEIVTLEEEGSGGSNGLGFLLVVVFIEILSYKSHLFMAYYQEGKLQQLVC